MARGSDDSDDDDRSPKTAAKDSDDSEDDNNDDDDRRESSAVKGGKDSDDDDDERKESSSGKGERRLASRSSSDSDSDDGEQRKAAASAADDDPMDEDKDKDKDVDEKRGRKEDSDSDNSSHKGSDSDRDEGSGKEKDAGSDKEKDEGSDKGKDDSDDDKETRGATVKDVFGDSSSSDEEGGGEGGTGLMGASVKLNKETGTLERGDSVEAPARVFESIGGSAGEGGEARRLSRRTLETLNLVMPSLERPKIDAKMYYVNLPKHIQLEPKVWEGSLDSNQHLSEHVVRWRYQGEKKKESNTRLVKWSDGSMTMHVGKEVLDLSSGPLDKNVHHLYVRQAKASNAANGEDEPCIECHGLIQEKLAIRIREDSSVNKKIQHLISRMSQKTVDKSDLFLKKAIDEKEQREALTQKESNRIRANARQEAQGRRRRDYEDMTEDFLEREGEEGNLGGIRNAFKRRLQPRQPDDSALRRAKAGGSKRRRNETSDDDSSSLSASSGTASASSSSSSEEEMHVDRKKARKSQLDSDDSD